MYDPFHSNRTKPFFVLNYFIELPMIHFVVIKQIYIILLIYLWSIS